MNVRRSTSHATWPVGSVRNMPTIAMRVSRLARRVASRRPLHDCDVSTTTSGPGAPKNRLSALWELRAALRAGDVWLDHGRRYADPETYLIPRDRWPELRPEALRLTGLPEAGSERLAQRAAELDGVLERLDRGLSSNDQLRLVGDDLTISPVKGEDLPESAEQLQEQVAERLPKLELADLLIEIDAWTGFTRRFEHAGGAEPRTKDLLTHLHAVIFAHACNFGLGQMPDIAELS